jgi:Xaa-Pro dipeptidase
MTNTTETTTTEASSPSPSLHFDLSEFAERRGRVCAAMAARGLDGVLVSRIEDQYWLTGLDTDGFCIFHALFLGGDGAMTHISRTADLANIRYSSICSDVDLWIDQESNSKAAAVRATLAKHRMEGKRIGVQLDTFGLLPALYLELTEVLRGYCEVVDASDLIRSLRLVKSARELEYLRTAGEGVDKMGQAAVDVTRAGAYEGEIMGRAWYTAFANDCDPPAHRPPIGNGTSAMNVRYTTRRKHVAENDQVTFELGAGYRHYHAAEMFVVLTGPSIDERHVKMHAACVDALAAVQDKLVPGNTLGEVYEAHRATFARHGYEHALLRACGYTMGATWPPTWMEQPQIYERNSTELVPHMSFFTHMILIDHTTGLTMSLGEQAIITDGPPEIITHVPRTPIIVGA